MKSSFELKLDRAREHLEVLQCEANAWVKGKPWRVVDEPDPNPPEEHLEGRIKGLFVHWRRFRLESIDSIPPKFQVIAGDCLFNLRSALDHLALSLALANSPGMTEGQMAASEFPIFRLPMDMSTETRKIGCIATAAKVIIKSLQPYNRGNCYARHPLWKIHELNRIDKHRMLTIYGVSSCYEEIQGVWTHAIGFRPGESMRAHLGPLNFRAPPCELIPNAILARYGIIAGRDVDVNMEPGIFAEIAFSKMTADQEEPVIHTLQTCLDFVCNEVVAHLSQFL